ncbi:Atypical chemokine receptor 4, partial [Trichoplax sp. H2]
MDSRVNHSVTARYTVSYILFLIAVPALSILGILLNIFVIIFILTYRKQQSNIQWLIGNLVLSDIFQGIQYIIIVIVVLATQHHGWPQTIMIKVCKITFFLWLIGYTMSIELLTLISLERYSYIRNRARFYSLSRRKLRAILIPLWLFAILISIPAIYIADVNEYDRHRCMLQNYCSPQKMHQTLTVFGKNVSTSQYHVKRIINMLILGTICFMFSSLLWLLNLSYIVYGNATSSNNQEEGYLLLNRITQIFRVLILLPPIYNPFIYVVANKRLAKRVFRCLNYQSNVATLQ